MTFFIVIVGFCYFNWTVSKVSELDTRPFEKQLFNFLNIFIIHIYNSFASLFRKILFSPREIKIHIYQALSLQICKNTKHVNIVHPLISHCPVGRGRQLWRQWRIHRYFWWGVVAKQNFACSHCIERHKHILI